MRRYMYCPCEMWTIDIPVGIFATEHIRFAMTITLRYNYEDEWEHTPGTKSWLSNNGSINKYRFKHFNRWYITGLSFHWYLRCYVIIRCLIRKGSRNEPDICWLGWLTSWNCNYRLSKKPWKCWQMNHRTSEIRQHANATWRYETYCSIRHYSRRRAT